MESSVTNCLEQLRFDNRFTASLPADPSVVNQPRQVMAASYSRVSPTPVSSPTLVSYSRDMANELGLSQQCCESTDFLQTFSGNQPLPEMDTYAMCYGGHQFGSWAGQLGDGRAINLGEVLGRNDKRWALQLKGAGPTPYSRSADGLAVMRSSLREYLCSEAMHHLGVPTTRALSLIDTGERVLRDMFYDGRSEYEAGAVVCRVSPSFVRFGHFQIHAARGEVDILQRLVEHTIRTDFPEFVPGSGEISADTVLAWFEEVARLTAQMIVEWMRVGFVHGVMNTDNMSILGLTIDYGPYGWLDNYDRDWTPNTTDAQGRRYRYGAQPGIASWNLAQLANALYPVTGLNDDVKPLQDALDEFGRVFTTEWHGTMCKKLGIERFDASSDAKLFEDLADLMEQLEADMTLFYRNLANITEAALTSVTENRLPEILVQTLYRADSLTSLDRQDLVRWLSRYGERLAENNCSEAERQRVMNCANPKYVPRNYLAQLAIDAIAEGDFNVLEDLLEVLRSPYDEQPGKEDYARLRPDWARHRAGCSMLSCSS